MYNINYLFQIFIFQKFYMKSNCKMQKKSEKKNYSFFL